MADIKKIKVGDTAYDIKDATAARSNHNHDSKYVKKSGDTITGKLSVQSGDASGCLQIGADVTSNTLTAGTRKLARMTFPTREYGTTKTCSIMSCDNMNNYNYVEFGGHIGDATNTAPDYMCFNVDKTHNSLSPATKECVMAISPTSLNLFSGALDAGQISSFDDISGKWVFNNANTFKNSGFTYTLPNKTGTVALTSNIPTSLKNPNSITFKAGSDTVLSYDGSAAKTFTVAASTTNGAFTISDGTTTRTIQLAGKFTDADTHYTNYLQIKGNGAEAVKFTQDSNKTLNLKPSGSVSISAASGEITISATDTHNSHIVYSGKKSDGTTDISSGAASSVNITLGDSGVAAGAYGDTADQTPGYNATFKVPSISVNAKGIVTAIGEHTVKIPDNSYLVPYMGASKDVNLGNNSLFSSDEITNGKRVNSVAPDGFHAVFDDDHDGDGKTDNTYYSVYRYDGITHNDKKLLFPEKEGTIAVTDDLSTLFDKGTLYTDTEDQVVYNLVEMKKALTVPLIQGAPSANNHMNGAPLYSLGSTMATENDQATGSSSLSLAGYTGATGNPRSTIIAQRASGDFVISPEWLRGSKDLCFSDSSDKWTIAGSPILTESSISTQQWTLTSTSGTVTTVNICTK